MLIGEKYFIHMKILHFQEKLLPNIQQTMSKGGAKGRNIIQAPSDKTVEKFVSAYQSNTSHTTQKHQRKLQN